MVSIWSDGFGKSFCSLWNGLAQIATERHGADLRSMAFISLRDDETASVMAIVRNACEELRAAELFGPSNAAIRAAAAEKCLIKSGFHGSTVASSDEIRVAWVFQHLEQYVVEREEVCRAWVKPFPDGPVNSVSTLTTYLRAAVAGWSAATQDDLDGNISATEQWRVLDNVQFTLAWLRRKGEITSVPEPTRGPRTMFTAGRYAAALERFLDEQTQPAVGHSDRRLQGHRAEGTQCSVILRGPTECPVVLGREVPRLTQPRYDVIQALAAAGEKGLSLDQLKRLSGHDTAEKTLKGLAKNKKLTEWKQVILLPGKPYCRYRLLFLSNAAKAG